MSCTGQNTDVCSNLNQVIRKEMGLFEATKTRPVNIEKSEYQALLTIKPTSVESERAFSSLGLFATRLRTRLSDESLDALVFMRQFYKKH